MRLFFVLGCLLVCGCGKPSTVAQVQGRILLDGQPLLIEQNDDLEQGMVMVELIPQDSQGKLQQSEMAIYDDRDGSFAMPGTNGDGIPPGNYKIVVQQLRSYADLGSDQLKGKFSAKRTPLSCRVNLDEENTVDIELSDFMNDKS